METKPTSQMTASTKDAEHLETLKRYNEWRTADRDDTRTYADFNITAKSVSDALNWAIDQLGRKGT